MSRYKNILFLVAVLVAQIIGLAAQVRRPNPTGGDGSSVRLIRLWIIGLVSPPEKVVHGSGTGLRGLWSNYLDLRHVREQNRELQERVGRLQLEQATLLEDARQGQRLQTLLAFKEKYIYSTVPAQVVGTSGTDQSRILYIDKGAKDGLRPDMAVITPDGIVGKLKDVFGHTSQVLVINDQTSGAGVLLETTRLRGVLRGNALGQPQIVNLLPDERVKPGEKVVTSGGDQIFPRGLPVGVVDQVVDDTSNPPYVDIVLKPAANLGHLEELLVITGISDQMPKKEQEDLAQSAAAGAAVNQQRASDILAERLPGLTDPTALAESGPGQTHVELNPDSPTAPKLYPPPALHADHYSPESTQPARALTPGQALVDPRYAPTPQSTPHPAMTADDAAKTVVKPAATPEAGAKTTTSSTRHSSTTTPAQGDTTTSTPAAHAPVVKKTPKPAPVEKPAEPATDAPAVPASPPPQ